MNFGKILFIYAMIFVKRVDFSVHTAQEIPKIKMR